MLVLAFDTSSAAVTVAVVESSSADVVADVVEVLASRQVLGSRGHGEALTPSISACLSEIGRRPADLGAVVAGLGPGPFTGLRVGLVTAAALGDALSVPTYGVCSLDAIKPDFDGELLVATDARRREVYWARYRDGVRLAGPSVDLPADVPTEGAAAMAGAGAREYADVLGLPLINCDFPSPVFLVADAMDRIAAGAPSEILTPLYLRRPDAVPPSSMKTVSQ